MPISDLSQLTLTAAADLIRTRQLSPMELTWAYLDRIERLNPTLNAFLTIASTDALAAAQAAESQLRAGDDRGPLQGIPIGIKDVFDTAGIRTTAQSRLLQDRVPTQDARLVQQLKQAGAILLGKTVMKEFATGGAAQDLFHPPARHPWDLERNPGGSSSGSAVAVAAGLCLGALGSDTGGSIRGPASYCGVAGLKPTYGRLSTTGMIPLAPTLDHAGVMAPTAQDCALLFQTITGERWPEDLLLSSDLTGIRIGICDRLDAVLEEEVRVALGQAWDRLRDLGAEMGEIELPPWQTGVSCGLTILYSEAYGYHQLDVVQHRDRYGEDCLHMLLKGARISAEEYARALDLRRKWCDQLATAMGSCDVLVTATTPAAAPLLAESYGSDEREQPNLMIPFNITGYPALSICNGLDRRSHLPLSLQIIAKPHRETQIFRVAIAYERIMPRPCPPATEPEDAMGSGSI